LKKPNFFKKPKLKFGVNGRYWKTEMVHRVCLFTNLLEHYNKLNKKLQGRNQFIDETWRSLRSFKTQLFMFSKCFEKNDLSYLKTWAFKTCEYRKLIFFQNLENVNEY
jgi:hypothetical protein